MIILSGLLKLIIAGFAWIFCSIFFYGHPLLNIPTWAASISAAIMLAGFIAYSGD